jgi:hypothetical protein
MEKKALIITPTGTDMFFDDAYDRDNHWRYTKSQRTYDTCVVVFNDYQPEVGTYDFIIRRKGLKWNLMEEVSNIINLENYDYIGCFDDDYATDIQSVNESLAIARHYDFRLFHQAAISYNTYECMRHNPEYIFTETDFIESGCPFFRNDIFKKVTDFLHDYKYEKSCWGIDRVMCQFLQTTAHVIHTNTVKHMRPEESSYDKADGFKALEYVTDVLYPKYMKEKFDIDCNYINSQKVLRAWKIVDND